MNLQYNTTTIWRGAQSLLPVSFLPLAPQQAEPLAQASNAAASLPDWTYPLVTAPCISETELPEATRNSSATATTLVWPCCPRTEKGAMTLSALSTPAARCSCSKERRSVCLPQGQLPHYSSPGRTPLAWAHNTATPPWANHTDWLWLCISLG